MRLRDSLQTKITIMFFAAIIAICLIGIGVYIKRYKDSIFEYYHLAVSMAISEDSLDETSNKFNIEKFTSEGFVLVTDKQQMDNISKIYDELIFYRKNFGKHQRRHGATAEYRMGKVYIGENGIDFGIILYNGDSYLVLNQAENERVVFQIEYKNRNYASLIVFGAIVLLLCFLYVATIRSIYPLRILRAKIKDFADGNDDIDIKIKGNDEIAEVANEFDAAVKKIHALREARRLFLRNIMHEFKTPITRGKLSLEMLEQDSLYRKILSKVFIRQENLLNEFTRIEQLGTGELKLDKSDYFLQDIIDYALDILGENAQNVHVEVEEQKIHADFDLLSTAIKNLLDNALIYSDDKKARICVKKGEITISNIGKPLDFPLEDYKKPFFMQSKKQKESRGFGFGLFISLNVFDLHDIQTRYTHENGESIFTLKF
ncbi:MAG: ArsS family sensor histidine kinase [Campylobacteraceae bacterium]|jgi:two-component system OmpR family sensor kinase|nr:ArsS family sensor histidine kinase [Campylobacteraceae bacterium]